MPRGPPPTFEGPRPAIVPTPDLKTVPHYLEEHFWSNRIPLAAGIFRDGRSIRGFSLGNQYFTLSSSRLAHPRPASSPSVPPNKSFGLSNSGTRSTCRRCC